MLRYYVSAVNPGLEAWFNEPGYRGIHVVDSGLEIALAELGWQTSEWFGDLVWWCSGGRIGSHAHQCSVKIITCPRLEISITGMARKDAHRINPVME